MGAQEEILKQFRQQQEKYAYYIIALSVTAIGFSVVKTSDSALNWSHLPLGLAVLSWGLSIYCGLNFLKIVISTLFSNYEYFNILKGQYPEVGSNPEMIKVAANAMMSAMETNSNTASELVNWQDRFFYAGIILFLSWHVLQMYLKAPIL